MSNIVIADTELNDTSSTAQHQLGIRTQTVDGRIFAYAQAGASGISAGKLQVAPTPKANHKNLAVTATAIGETKVSVTPGATAVVAGEYDEGLMIVNDADGEGEVYKISSHPAAVSATEFVVTLDSPIKNTALTASSQVTLVHNTYNGVIEGTSATADPAGVPIVDIATTEFGWLQTRGNVGVLADSTITVGDDVVAGSSVAGAIDSASDTAATNVGQIKVGVAIIAGVDTEYLPIKLNID